MSSDLVIRDLRGAFVGPVDLTVRAASCAVISGASGAGKSQFLRMIADLDLNQGDARLGAIRREAIAAPAWRSRVAYVAAEAGWWAANVADHFSAETRETAAALAAQLGVGDHVGRTVASLSTGERQRLALVRALARSPQALLLDEPTSSLDAASIAAVEGLLRDRIAAGAVLLVASHDTGQAERLGAQRYLMTCGKLAPA